MPSLEKLNGMIHDAQADYQDCLDSAEVTIGKLTALNTRLEVLKLLREVYYDE